MFRYKYKNLFLFRFIKAINNCNLHITIFYYRIDFLDKGKILLQKLPHSYYSD